jgi:DNA-directed RNA polymerase specialized sigma24 family protein
MCAKNITTIDELVTECQTNPDKRPNIMLEALEPKIRAYLHRKIALSVKDVNNHLDEMVQNTLIKISNNVDKLQNAESKTAYVYSIATNVLREFKRIDEREYQRSSGTPEIILLADSFEARYSGPLSETSYKSLIVLVVESFDNVDQLTVAIVDWRLFGNLTFKEIASEIGLSTSVCQKRFKVWCHKFEQQLIKKGYSKNFMMPAIIAYATATTEAGCVVPAVTATLMSAKASVALLKLWSIVLLSIALFMVPAHQVVKYVMADRSVFQSPIHIVVTPDTAPFNIKNYEYPNITLLQSEGVDLFFADDIIDADGDDIIITEIGPAGEACELYAVGEKGEMALLGIYAANEVKSALIQVQTSPTDIGIDLATTTVNFRFKKLRLVSLSNDGQIKGFELCAVKARKE